MFYRSIIILAVIFSCNKRNEDKVFRWESIEKVMSNEAKQKSLTLLDDQIVEGFNEQALETRSLGIYDLFHFIDLNNDRQDDVVFNGFGGASDEFVMVFLKNQAGYAKAFHDYGHITNLKIDSETMFYIKRPEMVGEESGDSLVIFKVEGDSIVKKSSKLIIIK